MKYVVFSIALAALTAAPALAQQDHPFTTGSKVEVEWLGAWYDAEVLHLGEGEHAGTYFIRYDGYSDSWNEYVGADRIRRRTSLLVDDPASTAGDDAALVPADDAKPADPAPERIEVVTPEAGSDPAHNEPAPNQSNFAGSPAGHYVCQSYNWQTGWLETQGEFVLNENGTYKDLWEAKTGSWTFDPATGRIEFAGILDYDAATSFIPDKHAGMIVYDWGNDVKRECYRQPD